MKGLPELMASKPRSAGAARKAGRKKKGGGKGSSGGSHAKPRQGDLLDGPLAKALSHPLRVRILAATRGRRVISPAEFARESGEPLNKVAGHFRRLVHYGALKLVEERTVRGAVEHRYTGTQRAVFSEDDWEALPESIQGGVAGAALLDFLSVSAQAIEGGTFGRRRDVVFTWDEFVLDEQAWKLLTAMLHLLWDKVADLEEEAALRLAESGEDGMATVVGLAGFEAAPGTKSERRCEKSSSGLGSD